MWRHDKELRARYVRGLRDDPQLAGTIHVRFVVQQDGRVGAVWQSPRDRALPSEALVACVLDLLKKLRFPSTGRVSTVTCPVAFAPK